MTEDSGSSGGGWCVGPGPGPGHQTSHNQTGASDTAVIVQSHFSQGSPVTSSKSLSPLNKKTRTRGGGARLPGFPQRVTSASVSSVCDTSGHSELRDTSDNAAGHKTVDIELDTTGSVSKHNLSLQLLGTVL